jgi:hypothetical protein
MPSYQFTGLTARVYPETRDAQDHAVGTVEPGERREFDEAPDDLWALSGDSGGQDDDSQDEPEGEPGLAGPQPVPPAVVPGT